MGARRGRRRREPFRYYVDRECKCVVIEEHSLRTPIDAEAAVLDILLSFAADREVEARSFAFVVRRQDGHLEQVTVHGGQPSGIRDLYAFDFAVAHRRISWEGDAAGQAPVDASQESPRP